MVKCLLAGLVTLLCLAALPELRESPALQTRSYTVTVPTLLVRTGPGAQYPVLRRLAGGNVVQGRLSQNGKWIKIGFQEYVASHLVTQQVRRQSKAHRIAVTDLAHGALPEHTPKAKETAKPRDGTRAVHREVTIFLCLFVLLVTLAWVAYFRSRRHDDVWGFAKMRPKEGEKNPRLAAQQALPTEFWDNVAAMENTTTIASSVAVPQVVGKTVGPLLHTTTGDWPKSWSPQGKALANDADQEAYDHRKWEKVLTLRLVYTCQKSPDDVATAVYGMMKKFANDPVFQTDLVQLVKIMRPYHIALLDKIPQVAQQTFQQWWEQDASEPYFPRELLQAFLCGLDASLCPFGYIADRDLRSSNRPAQATSTSSRTFSALIRESIWKTNRFRGCPGSVKFGPTNGAVPQLPPVARSQKSAIRRGFPICLMKSWLQMAWPSPRSPRTRFRTMAFF